MRRQKWILMIICALLLVEIRPAGVSAQEQDYKAYLPLTIKNVSPQIVNTPYIQVNDVIEDQFWQMSIFWFGKVLLTNNYVDVRVGYNDQALWIHTNIIDRRLWYNTASDGSNLENWDTVALLLHLGGVNQVVSLPGTQSYRFVTQLRWAENIANYQRTYRGNGQEWVRESIAFTGKAGWRGNVPNDNADDAGWSMAYKIPFSSLGLSGKPADGTIWRIGLEVYDRDSQSGAMAATQRWPDGNSENNPATWGILRFGFPSYSPPALKNVQTTTIRNKLNGAVVPDVAAGGGFLCGNGSNFWSEWGIANYAGEDKFNIQNQYDISDFPCFSKYYVTFPLSAIPAGKVVKSAKLVLHEFGGSSPSNAYVSFIHALRVTKDWNESTLNWNNGPQALEDVAQTWVEVYRKNPIVWPGDPYEWDVSRAVADAYEEGSPLRLALYSTDSAMHSGKYFLSSEFGDWPEGIAGRPTLIVVWGDPAP